MKFIQEFLHFLFSTQVILKKFVIVNLSGLEKPSRIKVTKTPKVAPAKRENTTAPPKVYMKHYEKLEVTNSIFRCLQFYLVLDEQNILYQHIFLLKCLLTKS